MYTKADLIIRKVINVFLFILLIVFTKMFAASFQSNISTIDYYRYLMLRHPQFQHAVNSATAFSPVHQLISLFFMFVILIMSNTYFNRVGRLKFNHVLPIAKAYNYLWLICSLFLVVWVMRSLMATAILVIGVLILVKFFVNKYD